MGSEAIVTFHGDKDKSVQIDSNFTLGQTLLVLKVTNFQEQHWGEKGPQTSLPKCKMNSESFIVDGRG